MILRMRYHTIWVPFTGLDLPLQPFFWLRAKPPTMSKSRATLDNPQQHDCAKTRLRTLSCLKVGGGGVSYDKPCINILELCKDMQDII